MQATLELLVITCVTIVEKTATNFTHHWGTVVTVLLNVTKACYHWTYKFIKNHNLRFQLEIYKKK